MRDGGWWGGGGGGWDHKGAPPPPPEAHKGRVGEGHEMGGAVESSSGSTAVLQVSTQQHPTNRVCTK
jgi:hypothetical protein